MIYEAMEPPFEIKDFNKLKKKEAKLYFDWFLTQIPSRVQLLREAYEFTDGGKASDLDFSVESLVSIWKWFIPYISKKELTQEEIEYEKSCLPELVHDFIELYDISTETLILANDISIYFGETLIKSYPSLYWGVKFTPKSRMGVNRPVVLGFKDDFGSTDDFDLWPINIITVLTYEVLEGKKDIYALINIFKVWSEYADY